MWVKKSKEEYLADKKKERKHLLRVAMGLWVFFALAATVLPEKYSARHAIGEGLFFRGLSPAEILVKLVVSFVVFGVGVYLLYWRPRVVYDRPTTLVCPKCETVKTYDNEYDCNCGGEFVDIREMKWVKHKK